MTPSESQRLTRVPSRTSTPSLSTASLAARRQRLRRTREHARSAFYEDNACGSGIDVAEIDRKRLACELCNGAGHLDPGRPAANDHKAQQAPPLPFIIAGLGALEGEQNAPPDVGRIVDLLEAGCELLPLLMIEISMRCAGGDDELVIDEAPFVGQHALAGDVDPGDLSEQDGGIALRLRIERTGEAAAGDNPAVATW